MLQEKSLVRRIGSREKEQKTSANEEQEEEVESSSEWIGNRDRSGRKDRKVRRDVPEEITESVPKGLERQTKEKIIDTMNRNYAQYSINVT